MMATVLLLSLCACAQKMQTEHDEPKMNTASKIIAAAEPDCISDTAGWVQQRHKRRTSMVSLSAVYFLKCRSCITYYISIAYLCKTPNETRCLPGTLEALRADGVQIVILDSPEIYSEYAPYTYIEDMKEFIDKVTLLNRAS